uniref:RebA n=1 Tax=Caedibacter taeniospiralis TaxID=28907 RepID=Q57297_CAETA|nr:RebA [Caedibacter taeniospiralis]AAA73408.1 RebA [Caedibacter taeniospiralis]prf//2014290A rebA gene [Caedibacter taeniospiralis]
MATTTSTADVGNTTDIVNSQITDSVTQTNTMVLGSTPAQIMTNLMQMSAQANALAMQNAVVGQKQTNMLSDAATTQGLSIMYTLSAASDGQAVSTVDNSTDMAGLIDALGVDKA